MLVALLRHPRERDGKRSPSTMHPQPKPEVPNTAEPPSEILIPLDEPQGVQKGIADSDKVARTGSKDEKVRDTPPAGAWNETSGD